MNASHNDIALEVTPSTHALHRFDWCIGPISRGQNLSEENTSNVVSIMLRTGQTGDTYHVPYFVQLVHFVAPIHDMSGHTIIHPYY